MFRCSVQSSEPNCCFTLSAYDSNTKLVSKIFEAMYGNSLCNRKFTICVVSCNRQYCVHFIVLSACIAWIEVVVKLCIISVSHFVFRNLVQVFMVPRPVCNYYPRQFLLLWYCTNVETKSGMTPKPGGAKERSL